MTKLPFMPFYGFDYETDERTTMLTDTEHGVYFRLLWQQWKEGSVPSDPDRAAKLIRSSDVTATAHIIRQFFVPIGDTTRVHNKKLDQIRTMKEIEHKAKSLGGKNSARKKKESAKSVDKILSTTRTRTRTRTRSKPRASGEPKRTWLTPYWDVLAEVYGGDPRALVGPVTKALRALDQEVGPEVLAPRLRRYCRQTEIQFFNAFKFAAAHPRYASDVIVEGIRDEDFSTAPEGWDG